MEPSNVSQNRPLTFSVLMSIYRGDNPHYLESALRSIYDGQIRKPDQIVIVVDGRVSQDLASIINNFFAAHKQITTIVKLSQNSGLGIALCEGSKKCTGDYIFRMDSDDISVPKRFQIQEEYITSNPRIDAFGGYIEEFENRPGDLCQVRRVPLFEPEIKKMLKMRNPMNHVTMCIRTNALRTAGNYEHMPFCEDYYLWAKMLAKGLKLANIPEVLVKVRVGNGFIGRRSSRKYLSSWGSVQRLLVENELTTPFRRVFALLSIRFFLYMPSSIKRILYSKILRSQRRSDFATSGH